MALTERGVHIKCMVHIMIQWYYQKNGIQTGVDEWTLASFEGTILIGWRMSRATRITAVIQWTEERESSVRNARLKLQQLMEIISCEASCRMKSLMLFIEPLQNAQSRKRYEAKCVDRQ
jgi:hypothetical protein